MGKRFQAKRSQSARQLVILSIVPEPSNHAISYLSGNGGIAGSLPNQLQAASYDWDLIGNLTRRSDGAANAVGGGNEYFCHDRLNRVTHTSASALSCASPTAAQFGYDTLGNLTKPGISTTYQTNTNKLLAINGQTVQYDQGGNITFDAALPNPRSYTYNAFDIPDSITQTVSTVTNPGTYKSQWGFGPDKQRTYEVTSKATVTGGNTFAPVGMT